MGFKAGQVLKEHSAAVVNEMIASIQAYNDSVKSAKWLVHPLANLHSLDVPAEHADEVWMACCISFLNGVCFDGQGSRSLIAQSPRSKLLTSLISVMLLTFLHSPMHP